MPMNDQRFDNVPARAAGTVFGLFIGVIGLFSFLAGGPPGSKIFYAALTSLGVLFAVRAGVSACAVVSDTGVTLRNFLFTRSVAWDQMESAEVSYGRTGLNSGNRKFLMIRKKDGSLIVCRDFNAPADTRGRDAVQEAFLCIQKRIQSQ